MGMQNFIKIYQKIQEIGPVSLLFQNLNLGKTSTNPKCHLTFSLPTSCQYQCAKFHQKIFFTVQELGPFSLFQNLELGKSSTDKNVSLQSLGLDLVNINVYAKVYQNIPLSSRDRAIFTFFRIWRSAKPRPMINIISQSLGLDVVNTNAYAKFYQNIPSGFEFSTFFTNSPVTKSSQNFITIFYSVQEIGPFSLFQNLELGKTSTDEK